MKINHPKSKYHAQRQKIDGVWWDSKAEHARWQTLWRLQQAGSIRGLRRQHRFPIKINDVLICTYVADFTYFKAPRWEFVVEDVKGFPTPVYKLKRLLMEAVWKIVIREV